MPPELLGPQLARFGPFHIHAIRDPNPDHQGVLLPYFEVRMDTEKGERSAGNLEMRLHALPDFLAFLERVIAMREEVAELEDYTIQEHIKQGGTVNDSYWKDREENPFGATAKQIIHGVQQLARLYPHTSAHDALRARIPVPPTLQEVVFGSAGLVLDATGAHPGELPRLATQFHLEPTRLAVGPFHIYHVFLRSPDGTLSTAYAALILETVAGEQVEVGVIGKDECDIPGIRQQINLCLVAYKYVIDYERQLGSFHDAEKQARLLAVVAIYEAQYYQIKAAFDKL